MEKTFDKTEWGNSISLPACLKLNVVKNISSVLDEEIIYVLIFCLLQVPDSMLWRKVSDEEWCKETLHEAASVCFPVGLNHEAVSNTYRKT